MDDSDESSQPKKRRTSSRQNSRTVPHSDVANGQQRRPQVSRPSSSTVARVSTDNPTLLNDDRISENASFIHLLLKTVDANRHRSPNNYKYNDNILRFATSLYILSGRYAYDYLRMNLKFALPSIQTVQKNSSTVPFSEAHFRFDESTAHLSSMDCRQVFLSEDCSGVIPRVEYDAHRNHFNGFVRPLVEGVPCQASFQCDSFQQLEILFNATARSTLVNVHAVQPISNSGFVLMPSAFVLAAYGTDNRFTSLDVLKRWWNIFEEFHSRRIRVLGFATDGDPKYLKSMRLASNFFAQRETIDLAIGDRALTINVPDAWAPWYYLDRTQLFLCMQDGTHLCTKTRNRLLSKTARLTMGVNEVSIQHLYELIARYNKLDHNLTVSDLDVRDRQNFSSCQRICDDRVLSILIANPDAKATYNYLLLLNLLVSAYTERSMPLKYRIYYAWIVVFYVRLWKRWLHVTKSSRNQSIKRGKRERSEQSLFITSIAYMSIEINAHFLIYIYLLIAQNKISPSTAYAIHLFSSQPCENVYRNARALSGTYSTRINFTIKQFLKRINRLNVLIEIKRFEETNEEHKIVFPTHHKIKRLFSENLFSSKTSDETFDVDVLDRVIGQAFQMAQEMATSVGIDVELARNDCFNKEDSSRLVHKLLNRHTLTESQAMDGDESDLEETQSDEEGERDTDYDDESEDAADAATTSGTGTFDNLRSISYPGTIDSRNTGDRCTSRKMRCAS